MSRAMHTSHAATRTTPPPAAWPAIRPTTGLGDSSITVTMSPKRSASGPSDALSSLRSAPAENVVPVLVNTMTRTESSASASRKPFIIPCNRPWLNALRLACESRVMVATPAATWYPVDSVISSPIPSGLSSAVMSIGPSRPVSVTHVVSSCVTDRWSPVMVLGPAHYRCARRATRRSALAAAGRPPHTSVGRPRAPSWRRYA